MKRTIATFIVGLVCAIAMSGAHAVAQNSAQHQGSAVSPIVVAQAQPTEADKKLADEIKQRYKPGSGSKASNSRGSADVFRKHVRRYGTDCRVFSVMFSGLHF